MSKLKPVPGEKFIFHGYIGREELTNLVVTYIGMGHNGLPLIHSSDAEKVRRGHSGEPVDHPKMVTILGRVPLGGCWYATNFDRLEPVIINKECEDDVDV